MAQSTIGPQVVDPGKEACPGGHSIQLVEPSPEYVLAGQVEQYPVPEELANLPAGQAEQVDEPAPLDSEPAGQALQLDAPAEEDLIPAGQDRQLPDEP